MIYFEVLVLTAAMFALMDVMQSKDALLAVVTARA